MQFLQDIMTQIGAFFTEELGESFEAFIEAIVNFVNGILNKEANF